MGIILGVLVMCLGQEMAKFYCKTDLEVIILKTTLQEPQNAIALLCCMYGQISL